MNKATFSRLIKDSTYISDADVQALEQVVQAFPYCQTAHMLLAKAAADKGSMLAPQRLRKAAIHAPSRALLKKLVEGKLSRQQPEQVLSQASGRITQITYNEEIEDLIENDLPAQFGPEKTQTAEPVPEALAAQTIKPDTPEPEEKTAELIASLTPAETEEEVAIAEAIPEEISELETEPTELIAGLTPAETEEEVLIAESAPEEMAMAQAESPETVNPETEPAAPKPPETLPDTGLTQFLAGLQEQDHSAETDELEIHPDKTELQSARIAGEQPQEKAVSVSEETKIGSGPEQKEEPFKEEDISEVSEPEANSEELPELVLAEPETEEKKLAEEITLTNQPEIALSEQPENQETANFDSLVFSIFRDSELGYAMSSSRMGESLQRKGELTREVPFHFQPELLVEYKHATAQTGETASPEMPETPPQQDLINDFLKQAAKSRPRATILPKQEEQEDLSQKSTRLSKSIVSENLAQIFAMQGKTKKAIKIYQQLQLKMPEKKDYFAVQINKLQNHSS